MPGKELVLSVLHVEKPGFYFKIVRGGGKIGNDHYILSVSDTLNLEDLVGVNGVRLVTDANGLEKLKEFLVCNINKKAAEILGISPSTISRIRKGLNMPHMGKGGDRKSHRYYRKTYDEPAKEYAGTDTP